MAKGEWERLVDEGSYATYYDGSSIQIRDKT
jgi:hypothetical protein